MNTAIAITSIVTSAIVGLAGIGSSLWLRRADRMHEMRLMVRERREEAYAALMSLMLALQDFDLDAVNTMKNQVAVATRLWGSREVRVLFTEWIGMYPNSIGPLVSEKTRTAVDAAANRLSERMADEVQGRES